MGINGIHPISHLKYHCFWAWTGSTDGVMWYERTYSPPQRSANEGITYTHAHKAETTALQILQRETMLCKRCLEEVNRNKVM